MSSYILNLNWEPDLLDPHSSSDSYSSSESRSSLDPHSSFDSYASLDSYGSLDSNGSSDSYVSSDSYSSLDSYGSSDSYTSSDSYGSLDSYVSSDSYSSLDSYGSSDSYVSSDSYTSLDSYGSQQHVTASRGSAQSTVHYGTHEVSSIFCFFTRPLVRRTFQFPSVPELTQCLIYGNFALTINKYNLSTPTDCLFYSLCTGRTENNAPKVILLLRAWIPVAIA
jgi:hypothetical protein